MVTVKQLREDKGLTQEDLHQLSTVATQVISHMETGKQTVSKQSVERVARALGVNPSDITGVNIASRVRGKSA